MLLGYENMIYGMCVAFPYMTLYECVLHDSSL